MITLRPAYSSANPRSASPERRKFSSSHFLPSRAMRITWPKQARLASLSDTDNGNNTASFQELWAEVSRSNSITRRTDSGILTTLYYRTIKFSYLFEQFYPHCSPTGAQRPTR
ncbi:Piso0_005107 [Millerozyma farinosa CBS 7064]|uniref:Piso0_005107 protein n=1 Tax=Pichia sorbitophila (strain ATCC MYA-4447 / BCRC 22081 / CBS 7064 / NBRC 10061 / NRRL Y-12695) TaxID=559304 RepID=G8Y490_PICSO|nr:Piso0_005107 [Millerozyma farinosa CBS 7064]